MFKVKNLLKKAKKLDKTIVFPEAEISPRVIKAVEIVLRKKIANVILLGDEEKILKQSCHLKGATIINPKTSPLMNEFIDSLVEIRKHKGLTREQAKKLLKNNFYFACMLVQNGYADGYLGGSETSTANTLRPALQIIKTREDVKLVSSCVLLVGTQKLNFGSNNVLVVADCALNINPTAEQLKDITLATVSSAKTFCDVDAKVAMLSFSTLGSGGDEDESIKKIRKAKSLIEKVDKTICVDGEMQLDCAIVPEVAKVKAKDSSVAGKANVLIFPDLTSGNIGYKLMERFGRLQAVGVIMQGFKKPVNDLSRGCSVNDIVVMTAVTCLQS